MKKIICKQLSESITLFNYRFESPENKEDNDVPRFVTIIISLSKTSKVTLNQCLVGKRLPYVTTNLLNVIL